MLYLSAYSLSMWSPTVDLRGGGGQLWHRLSSYRNLPAGCALSCRSGQTGGAFLKGGGGHLVEGWAQQVLAHHRDQYLPEMNTEQNQHSRGGPYLQQNAAWSTRTQTSHWPHQSDPLKQRAATCWSVLSVGSTHTLVCCRAQSESQRSPVQSCPHTSTVPCCRGTAWAHKRRPRRTQGCAARREAGGPAGRTL